MHGYPRGSCGQGCSFAVYGTRNPRECAARYAAQGADRVGDAQIISATPEGRRTARDVVERIRQEVALPLTVGGGVRTAEDAARLLDSGADKVALNTAAVDTPERLQRLSQRFGAQCIVVSIDARRVGSSWRVVTRSGTNRTALDAVDWAKKAVSLGAGGVLLTSVDKDGTRSGYDCDLGTGCHGSSSCTRHCIRWGIHSQTLSGGHPRRRNRDCLQPLFFMIRSARSARWYSLQQQGAWQ